VFSNLNVWEIGGLLLLALFIFGPERLPKVISDAARMIRTLRGMARNATSDLSRELGHDVSLEDLHPKTFLRKHLLSEEDEATLRRPFEDALRDVKEISSDSTEALRDVHKMTTDSAEYLSGRPRSPEAAMPPWTGGDGSDPYENNGGYGQPQHPGGAEQRRYDTDAT